MLITLIKRILIIWQVEKKKLIKTELFAATLQSLAEFRESDPHEWDQNVVIWNDK